MAKFAPVAPIQILQEMKSRLILGDYHLLLAHHVLEHPQSFHELFSTNNYTGQTIIMDNSIVELGASQNEGKVLEACKALQSGPFAPNYVFPVLTDVMGDGAATREAAEESYEWWVNNAPAYRLMAVLQGNSWEDFCLTADKFLLGDFPKITYVGIPRVLVKYLGSRQRAIEYVEAIRPDIAVHLLGFSDDVTDDIICANHRSIEGIDSAVPIRYDGVYTPTIEVGKRDPKWFDEGQYTDSIEKNLYNIRKWVV